ncbi:MAG TPA: sugar phosphate isomerase/epimerase family protein [Vicinamibacterales bacterium]|nr:sugar phosphate isomerase/epimerase family protein [Vicinamibacterales bacterium]
MTRICRRTFLSTLAAAAAPAIVRAQDRTPRLPITFSTLGCPKWPWRRVLDEAARLGYAGIELRGIQMQMDLTKLPEFTGTRIAESRKDVEALGLKISDLGASARMHESDPAARAAQLDEGRRFVDLAQQLGVPYVRVFGDKIPPGDNKADVTARVVEGLRTLGQHARGSGVTIILESHGDFTDSGTLQDLMTRSAMENVALLWDAHHTCVAGKEQPAATFAALGKYVRHTHLKDSRPDGAGRRYVLTGTGEVPVRDTVAVLIRGGYKGFYGFEWEKGWHPEIEEPEIAFPHFVETMKRYLAEAK